jgi:hypothetical protein
MLSVESAGAAKVLQSEKNAVEILDTMDTLPPETSKIRTETHEMDVLDALEGETLESHNSVLHEAIARLLCRL